MESAARLLVCALAVSAIGPGGASSTAAQPMCTPSRAALMTGRYPHRCGLKTLAIPSAGTYGLATDEWLLPEALKEEAVPPLILTEALGVVKPARFGSVVLPAEETAVADQP